MALSRIIYASRATSCLTADEFEKLVNISSLRNSRRNITGALIYCQGFFLQMLEGEKSVIDERFAHILHDVRHYEVQLLCERAISSRSFATWDMSLLHESDMRGNEKTKFHKITCLLKTEPDLEILGDSANEMLQELKDSIQKQTARIGLRKSA